MIRKELFFHFTTFFSTINVVRKKSRFLIECTHCKTIVIKLKRISAVIEIQIIMRDFFPFFYDLPRLILNTQYFFLFMVVFIGKFEQLRCGL
jgi:hypothetical protein